MNIYLIEAIEAVDYDCVDSFCIVANNEEEVRQIASENGGDEEECLGTKYYFWSDPLKSEVQLVGNYIGEETEPFILIASFNAG